MQSAGRKLSASPSTSVGTVGITTDVTAALDKFRNLPGAPIKARCDIEPAVPDQMVNMTDITSFLDAFRGFGHYE